MMSCSRSYRGVVRVHRCGGRFLSDVAAAAAGTHDVHETESKQQPKPYEDIPGPNLHPLLSVLRNFAPIIGKYGKEGQHLYSAELLKTYGKIVRDPFIGYPKVVHVFDPKDIEKVFRNEGTSPTRMPLKSLLHFRQSRPDLYTSPGLLNGNGDQWYTLRQRVQKPLIHPENREFYLRSVVEVADDFMERLPNRLDQKSECPQFMEELYKWAAESIAYLVFGKRMGALNDEAKSSTELEAKRLIDAAQDSFMAMNKLELSLQLFRYFDTPSYRKLARAQEVIAKTVAEDIEATMKRLSDHPEDSEKSQMILVKMLEQKDIEKDDIVSTVNDLFLAGVDTTSHTLGLLLYHLAKNPGAQETLYKELEDVFPDVNCPMTMAHLQRLPFLKACLKESLRLTPTVNGTVRTLESDVVLSGYNVPAGTLIVLQTAVAGIHGNHYENQDRFQPERFLRSQIKSTSTASPFATLPFGFGGRSCIGRRIAELEIYVLLAKMIRRFRIEYRYEDIKLRSRFINAPDRPLKFTFLDREK